MGQQEGEEEEETTRRGRGTHLLLAFLQTDVSKEEQGGGGAGRRRSWEGKRQELSGMNNGWRILRDYVKTLIMDRTQLEGARGHLRRIYLRKERRQRKAQIFWTFSYHIKMKHTSNFSIFFLVVLLQFTKNIYIWRRCLLQFMTPCKDFFNSTVSECFGIHFLENTRKKRTWITGNHP